MIQIESHTIDFKKTEDGQSDWIDINIVFADDIDIESERRKLQKRKGGGKKKEDEKEKEKEKEEEEVFDLEIVDKLISLFNTYNSNMVKKYDYRIENDQCELMILFKAMNVLNKQKEKKRFYAFYNVQVDEEEKKVVFHKKTDKSNTLFKLKDDAECLPIKNLHMFYAYDKNKLQLQLHYTIIVIDGGDTHYENNVRDFLETMWDSFFERMMQHIYFQNGKLCVKDKENQGSP